MTRDVGQRVPEYDWWPDGVPISDVPGVNAVAYNSLFVCGIHSNPWLYHTGIH